MLLDGDILVNSKFVGAGVDDIASDAAEDDAAIVPGLNRVRGPAEQSCLDRERRQFRVCRDR